MDHEYLLQALTEAEKGRGFTAPNPAVGAIIVKNNKILGAGYHQGAGLPHAEVEALKDLTPAETLGATLYVTLEPCCHWGKTPPCTDLIIQHNFARVVYGFEDPNPLVAGLGAALLKKQGIECVHLSLEEIEKFYQSYHHWQQTQCPFITAKLAMSLDGKIAGVNDAPLKITGEKANEYTHQCRKKMDGILTTVKTVINDNPQFNARLPEGEYKKPVYILDRYLRFPLSARLNQTATRITLFHQHQVDKEVVKRLQENKIHCVAISTADDGLDLKAVTQYIGKDGIMDLWVESGGQCLQRLIQLGLVNKSLFYIASKTLGHEATNAFHGSDLFNKVQSVQWHALGEDVLCEMTW